MKKLCMLLLLAAIGKNLPAQEPYYIPPPSSELLYNFRQPDASRIRFDFLLPKNNRMIIEVKWLAILQRLPDPDSLFKKVWSDLEPLHDSLSDPLMVRRVDYTRYGTATNIRIKEYQPTGTYFTYKDDELVQLKVNQDTLCFKGYLGPAMEIGGRSVIFQSTFYSITLVLNNISDVAKIPADMLASGIELLLSDLGPLVKKTAKKTNATNYYAAYDLGSKKRVSPLRFENITWGKTHGFVPCIQAGIQYARGAWIPSAGAGMEYYSKRKYDELTLRLLWEPHFYFQRDDKDKVALQRNDFITVRFHSAFKNSAPGDTFEFIQNFSFGALIHREGDTFEKGTFKFGLPGLQTKNILIEPEFFFNDFFRNFSPSLKLILYFD